MNKKAKIAVTLLIGLNMLLIQPWLYQAGGEQTASLSKEKERLREIEKDVKEKKRIIEKQGKKERSMLRQLTRIDQKLDGRNRELRIYESNLSRNQKQMENVKEQMYELENEIGESLDQLKGRLRAIYKSGGMGLVRVIFSARSINELFQSMALMHYVARSDAEILKQLRDKQADYLKKKEELNEYQSKVNLYKKRALREKDVLEEEKKKRRRLLASVKQDKDKQVSLLKDLEIRSKELHKIIENWSTRSHSSGEFGKMKGSLIWPVQGSVLIPFGLRFDKGLNRKIVNNGIHIKATMGSDILSVASGRVIYAGWFWGYGKLIIIDHGSGYDTVYAHASELFVREGENIEAGGRIAAVGETDSMLGPELYFEIRFKGRPLDPVLWLDRNRDKNRIGKKKGLPKGR